jgi:choline-sulfatase
MKPFGVQLPRGIPWAALVVPAALLLALAWGGPARCATRPNIILIVVDALRPDHLGCYGYDLPTSPTIDGLASRGTVFETAIAQASWTKASFASLVTSRYPFQTGVTDWFSVLPDTVATLQEALAAGGYDTFCVINMVGLAGKFGLLRGFAKAEVADKYERLDPQTTDAALTLVAEARPPFFGLIHYFGAHDPYRPSRESLRLVAPELAAAAESVVSAPRSSRSDSTYQADETEEDSHPASFDVRLYDACIRDIDREIGRIAAFLEERGLAGDTVIIITADHGEAFQEHGRFSHGWSLFDEEIAIPLILRDPAGRGAGQRPAFQVRSIDIFPTVTTLVGLEAPAGIEGRNLLGPEGSSQDRQRGSRVAPPFKPFFPPEVAYCETSMRKVVPYLKAVRTLERKAVVEPATGVISMYDLTTDPGETDDLWPDRVDSRDPLLKMLSGVPGFSAGGWRLAFTGAGHRDVLEVSIKLTAPARIVDAEKMGSRGRFDIVVSPDRRSMRATGATPDLNLLVFDTEPADAELEIVTEARGTATPKVYVGRRAERQPGEWFRVTSRAASGPPYAFEQCRETHTPAAFVWWAPGQKIYTSPVPANLTPEEERRLRALGYIQ